jgi:ArsR family transcriptional regulator
MSKHQRVEQRLVEILRACMEEMRIRLLNLLIESDEVCVYHLVEALGESQPKVSRHLSYLRRAGVVTTRRDGLWVYYRLAEPLDRPAMDILSALRRACAGSSIRAEDLEKLRAVQAEQPILRMTQRVTKPDLEVDSQPDFPLPRELDVELL